MRINPKKYSVISVNLGIFGPFLLLALLGGGVMQAALIIYFLVICTGGVGLVIVIPAWIISGTIIYKISNYILGQKGQHNGSNKGSDKSKILSNDQKALTDYINNAKGKGVSDDQIFSLLKNNGWAEKAIHEAFGLVASQKWNINF